jgi:hypothetical protein
MKTKLIVTALAGVLAFATTVARAANFVGNVQGANQPIAGAAVTVYAAGSGAPVQLAQGKTDDSGAFTLAVDQTPADSVLYVVAKGGTPKAATDNKSDEAIVLLSDERDHFVGSRWFLVEYFHRVNGHRWIVMAADRSSATATYNQHARCRCEHSWNYACVFHF